MPFSAPRLHHVNCCTIQSPVGASAVGHCVILEEPAGLVLIDVGLGLADVRDADRRLGRELIEAVGFRPDESETMVRHLERLGRRPEEVLDIVLTHADPDHSGGLVDFPNARVHIAAEEHAALMHGNPRYLPVQFEHGVQWRLSGPSKEQWRGLEFRPLPLGLACRVGFIPLFGHTQGHCGVLVHGPVHPFLHVGDAYYLRGELEREDHPVSGLAASRAENNELRLASLNRLRALLRAHPDLEMSGYHDPEELEACRMAGARGINAGAAH